MLFVRILVDLPLDLRVVSVPAIGALFMPALAPVARVEDNRLFSIPRFSGVAVLD